MKVSWSPVAREALAAILTDLRKFSEASAVSWGDRIAAKADLASVFPESHRVVPEVGDPSIREIFAEPYRSSGG